MNIPKLPTQTTPFLWGAVAGAIVLAIFGFNWGGWVTGGTAERLAVGRADAATVSALAPICVAQFQKSARRVGQPRGAESDQGLGAGRLLSGRAVGQRCPAAPASRTAKSPRPAPRRSTSPARPRSKHPRAKPRLLGCRPRKAARSGRLARPGFSRRRTVACPPALNYSRSARPGLTHRTERRSCAPVTTPDHVTRITSREDSDREKLSGGVRARWARLSTRIGKSRNTAPMVATIKVPINPPPVPRQLPGSESAPTIPGRFSRTARREPAPPDPLSHSVPYGSEL